MYVFNTTLNSPVRSIQAKVELFNSSTLVNTYYHTDSIKSITIERVGEQSKFFGFGICHKANIKLINIDNQINVSTENHFKIYFSTDNTNWLCPYPDLYVSQVNRNATTNELSTTCYDKIYDLAAVTFNELALSAPYSINNVAAAIASYMGLTLNKINVDDTSFEIEFEEGANVDGTETLRSILDDIAEATQTIYYLNQTELVFKRLKKVQNGDLYITNENYIDSDFGKSRRLATICSTTELGDSISASITETGTTQYIRDNVFWDLREDRAALVNNALAAVGGLTIAQFDLKWRGDFRLEIGDCIGIQGLSDTSFILNDTIEYKGALSEKTLWKFEDNDAETPSNPSTLGEIVNQTYARVDKANREIELLTSAVSDNSEQIAQIYMNTDGIIANVSSLQQQVADNYDEISDEITTIQNAVEASVTSEEVQLIISEEISNGVGSVTTSTGFTFNDEGLSISKSGTEMSTTISEDGMTVYKNNMAVLTANNTGVDATNLHATTYLLIGNNSRIEDYKGNRTAIFFIG